MKNGALRAFLTTAVVLFVFAGCTPSDGSAEQPPPWVGGTEMEMGALHEYGEGHRVGVHEVSHRVSGTVGGDEVVALAAEVEFCAGGSATEVEPHRLFLFQETEFDMQGETRIMNSSGPPALVDLVDSPLPEEPLEAGECARGWVEFLNVYDDHGTPTKLAFMSEDQQTALAIWPAAEE